MIKALILIDVEADRREVVPCTRAQRVEWMGMGCARCERNLEEHPSLFLIGTEVSCARCLTAAEQRAGDTRCAWCSARNAPRRDHGERECDPHWAVHQAFVADGVDPQSDGFRVLMREVSDVLRAQENRRSWKAWERYLDEEDRRATQAREDHPTGAPPG